MTIAEALYYLGMVDMNHIPGAQKEAIRTVKEKLESIRDSRIVQPSSRVSQTVEMAIRNALAHTPAP